ncbi:hypothetical protein [Paenibacillus sp.]|nr:hypothetical protein [Paenibacillus sp.]
MANGGKKGDSWAQRNHEKQNARGSEDKVPGIDKKLNGPNRPAE